MRIIGAVAGVIGCVACFFGFFWFHHYYLSVEGQSWWETPVWFCIMAGVGLFGALAVFLVFCVDD